MSINFRAGGVRLPLLPPFNLLLQLFTLLRLSSFFRRSHPALLRFTWVRALGERGKEKRGEEPKRGLGVPIRPDLIPIGCPNLSRLRGTIGKSGVGGGEKDEEDEERRRKRDRRRGPRGAPRRRRVPIDRDEGEENSRRNERASERARECG